jgi:nicotinate-nucleotide adenylyltransferase
MKTIGFFGGSFDPIHFGHLHLAIQMLEKEGIDEVLFCPAYCSPFKMDLPPAASGKDRFKMIQLAIADVPAFRVTPIEIELPGASFTVDTLSKLREPNVSYRLILSHEIAAHFHGWKDPEKIRKLASPVVGTRTLAISSTDIRERLKKKLYCGHLVPKEALDYIAKHGLYY